MPDSPRQRRKENATRSASPPNQPFRAPIQAPDHQIRDAFQTRGCTGQTRLSTRTTLVGEMGRRPGSMRRVHNVRSPLRTRFPGYANQVQTTAPL